MAELQTEMTPVDGQISNDVHGAVRVASATQGGAVIVTDEATLSNKLPSLLAGVSKTKYDVNDADDSGRQWPSTDNSVNFTWNTVSGRTITKESDHISYVETRGSTSAADSILADISGLMARPETTGFTIEVDFKIPDATPGSDYSDWFSVFGVGKDGSSGVERTILSVGFDKGPKKLDIHYINETSKYSSPSSLDLSNRIKVLASWDGEKFYLFINGEKVRTVNCSVPDFSIFKNITLGQAEQGTSQTKVEIYNVSFIPKCVTDPYSHLADTGFKDFALKSDIEDVVNEKIGEKITNTETKLESRIFSKSFNIFKAGVRHPGFLSAITVPKYRIPTVCVTKKNTLLAFSDYRQSAADETLIQTICARSLTGGESWSYNCIATAEGSDPVRRVMDSTVLLNTANNHIFVLLGNWKRGGYNWCNTTTADAWVSDGRKAVLLKSTNDGATFVQKTLSPAANSDTNVQINGMPSECKGFLGGVGAGIRLSDGKLVFPIQWTPGSGKVYSTIIYSENNGDTWTWGSGKIQSATSSPDPERWGSAEHMVVEMPDGKIVSLSRTNGSGATDPKRAFYTEDLGATWHVYTPLDRKVPMGAECQGSFIKIETVKGVTCYLITAPSCSSSAGDYRSGVSLYVFRYNAQDPDSSTVVPIYDINVPQCGGYSSLAYMKHPGGEKLVSISEEQLLYTDVGDPKSTKIEDLTFLIARIEALSEEGSVLVEGLQQSLNTLNSQISATDIKVSNYENRISALETGGEVEDVYIRDGKVASFFVSGLNNDTKAWVSQEGNITLIPTTTEVSGYSSRTSGVSVSSNDSKLVNMTASSNGEASLFRCENFNASNIFTNDAATIQFKLRINTKFTENYHTTFGMFIDNLSSASNYRIGFAYNKDNMRQIMNCCLCSGGANGGSDLSRTIPMGETIFVTMTYGNKFKLFINNKKVLEKNKNGSTWEFDRINQFIIGNKLGVDQGRVVNMDIGDILIYNRELTENEVYKNFCLGFGFEESVGVLNDLETESKDNVVSAINEVMGEILVKPELVFDEKIVSIGATISKNKVIGDFKSGDSIDDSGRTWTATDQSTRLTWETGLSGCTVSKSGSNLKVVSNVSSDIDNGKNKYPHIDLNPLITDGTGLTLLLKFKYLEVSSLGDWPCLLSVKRNGSNTEVLSMGITKRDNASATNVKLNYHVKNNWTSNDGDYSQYNNITTALTAEFNTVIVTVSSSVVKIYVNNQLLSTTNITLGNLNNIGGLYLAMGNRFNNNTKIEYSDMLLLKRVITESEIARYNDPTLALTEAPEWYKDIIARLDALENPSLP